jgi:hypothetical protein
MAHFDCRCGWIGREPIKQEMPGYPGVHRNQCPACGKTVAGTYGPNERHLMSADVRAVVEPEAKREAA